MVSDAASGSPDLQPKTQPQDQPSAAHLEVYSFSSTPTKVGGSGDNDPKESSITKNSSSGSTSNGNALGTEDSLDLEQEKLNLGLKNTSGLYPTMKAPLDAGAVEAILDGSMFQVSLTGTGLLRGRGGTGAEKLGPVGRRSPATGEEKETGSSHDGDDLSYDHTEAADPPKFDDQTKPTEPPKFDDQGRRTASTVEVPGVGKVGVAATRDKNNQVNKLDLRIGNDTVSYARGLDGTWSRAAGKPGEKPSAESVKGAEKALKSLGIETGTSGKFRGNLDLTSDGSLRYQSSDAPDKKVSYLSPAGTITKFNFENYTRETIAKDGNTALHAWDGKKFVPAQDVTRTELSDGTVKSTVSLKGSHNKSIERLVNPGKPGSGEGLRDETRFNNNAGDTTRYNWLAGTKTNKSNTTHLDGTTGRYREGKVSGNTVTFTDKDPGSKVTSVTRDTKAGTATYKGPGGYEVTKSLSNDAVLSTKTDIGKFTFGGDGKDPHSVDRFTLNGKTYTRVGANKDGGLNHEIARGNKTIKDFQPKSNEDLNEYKDDKGQKFLMSVVVGQDGKVKTAVAAKDGKPLVREHPPQSSIKDAPPGAVKPDIVDGKPKEEFDKPKEKTPAEIAKQKEEIRPTKFDRDGKPTEYQYGKENLKLTKNGDGSWSDSKLDAKKPYKAPSEFAKNIYTNKDLSPEQKERIVANAKKFDSMKNFSDEQKKEVYKQAGRLLDGKDGALSSKEKAELSDQLFWHVANNTSNDQGRNKTCNVTVLRGMALKDQPAVVAKLTADVANYGKFTTKDGTTINVPMDSVRVRPGSPESTFPPEGGHRTALGKLWDVSMVNSKVQRDTKDPLGNKVPKGSLSYKEVTPESRTDTGGRIVRKNEDGSESVLHFNKDGVSKPNDSPLLGGSEIADTWNQLTGQKLDGRYLLHSKRGAGEHFEKLVGGKIGSEDQLKESLTKLGDKSAIVSLNSGRLQQLARQRIAAEKGQDPTKVPRPEGGNHVVLVSDYDPKTGTVKIDNSWGQKNDVRISVSDLYDSMQTMSKGSGGKYEWKTPKKK